MKRMIRRMLAGIELNPVMTEDTLSSEIVSPQRVENYETNDDLFQDRADGAIKTWKVGNSSGKYTGVPSQT